MAPFFILPILFRGGRSGSGGDPIRRCSNCGEPITLIGKFSDRHPSIVGLSVVAAVLFGMSILISFASWEIDQNYPTLYPPEEIATYHGYVLYNLKAFWETLHHL